MRASLKLRTSQYKNKNGFPVVLSLRHKSFKEIKRTVARAFPEHWNAKNTIITAKHPQYDLIIVNLLDIVSDVKRVNAGLLTYAEAKDLLFAKKKQASRYFYDEAAAFFGDSTTGKLNKTVMNSFNTVYPNVETAEISREMAENYMQALMLRQKPNGVHTYLRKLSALFNKVSDLDNPFRGVRPKKVRTASKHITDTDLKKIITTRTFISKYDRHSTQQSINFFRDYFLLMFYLGGIDLVDLAALRYDRHVFDNRIQFTRNKGGTNVVVNNLIVPQAAEILKRFNCAPFLVPIYTCKDYKSFRDRLNRCYRERLNDLELTRIPTTKSARYTFINRAQNLLIDERITIEIVGHSQQSTHSIYTNEFPLSIKDAAHLKIVEL